MKSICKIHIIGGASGVGKTSLLKNFLDIDQINTGDLFKFFMSIENRDEIKKGDWSKLECLVIDRMTDIVCNSIDKNSDLIIDTHFAAKIHNKSYRVGLLEDYLCRFGRSIFNINNNIVVNVILISTDPYLLLSRRGLDKTRNRDLVPSDCYNDLRCNEVYSRRYSSALRRAKAGLVGGKITYHIIRNEILEYAKKQLTDIVR